jgi:hypothetical protein
MPTTYKFYTNTAEQNTFQNISSNQETSIKPPTGYSYVATSWQPVYNYYTGNVIGKIVLTQTYVNTQMYGSNQITNQSTIPKNYILLDIVYFIEDNNDGIPTGQIELKLNYIDIDLYQNPNGINTSVIALSGNYFGKNVISSQADVGAVQIVSTIIIE